MIMNAVKLSASIRAKKKKLMDSDPEMVGTMPGPDINPNKIFDMEQDARIRETIKSPERINADDKYDVGYQGVGESPEQKARMPRLRAYLDKLDMWM